VASVFNAIGQVFDVQKVEGTRLQKTRNVMVVRRRGFRPLSQSIEASWNFTMVASRRMAPPRRA